MVRRYLVLAFVGHGTTNMTADKAILMPVPSYSDVMETANDGLLGL